MQLLSRNVLSFLFFIYVAAPFRTDGYVRDSCFVQGDTILADSVTPRIHQLGELLVTAPKAPRVTATGEIFRLSEKARQCGDPFKALAEIPLLVVDISNRKISLRGGETPLILINGKTVNTGIAPIDPKFIESVEIQETVSAKYINMGITTIIDIRLKRDVPLYTYLDLRTRHEFPVREGFEAVNFEVGSRKIAVFGSLSSSYLRNNRIFVNKTEEFSGEVKNFDSRNVFNNLGWEAEALVKWEPDSTNYFSAYFEGKNTHYKFRGSSEGVYTTRNTTAAYSTQSSGRNVAEAWHAALYQQHIFRDKSLLSSSFSYVRKNSESREAREEFFSEIPAEPDINKSGSFSDSYTVDIDYDTDEKKWGNLIVGNSFEYQANKDFNKTISPSPSAKTATLGNHTYATYYFSLKRFLYMVSVGARYLHTATPIGNNSWWRPQASASLTWRLPSLQFMRLSYSITNQLPSNSQLFTFNTSVNPWLGVEGNPYLKPIEKNSIGLSYEKYIGPFNLRGASDFGLYNNMIESFIKDSGNGAIRSFRNNGSYRWTEFSVHASGSISKLNGGISIGYNLEKYHSAPTRPSYQASMNLHWNFSNFFIYATMRWRNRAYTPIEMTEYRKPYNATFLLNWHPLPNLNLSLGTDYWCGIKVTVSTISQPTYHSVTKTRHKSASLRPWLLISWTIRRNSSEAIPERQRHSKVNIRPDFDI